MVSNVEMSEREMRDRVTRLTLPANFADDEIPFHSYE